MIILQLDGKQLTTIVCSAVRSELCAGKVSDNSLHQSDNGEGTFRPKTSVILKRKDANMNNVVLSPISSDKSLLAVSRYTVIQSIVIFFLKSLRLKLCH